MDGSVDRGRRFQAEEDERPLGGCEDGWVSMLD